MTPGPAEERRLMRRAVRLAERAWGMTSPNPLVGALLWRDGGVIGEGWHRRAGLPHAEIEALRDAGGDAAGATLFVTLEPCSTTGRTGPCTEALIAAGIRRVVIGSLDPNPLHAGRGVEILRAAGIEVVSGVEEPRCRALNRAFFRWITCRRPFVLLKMAQTLDGRIATRGGVSKWITGPAARRRVQKLRQWCDAIMVSAETVRLDHPRLDVREPADWERQPLIVVARRNTPEAEIRAAFPPEREVLCATFDTPDDWRKLLETLGARGVTALLIEGGGELAARALAARAVDRVEFHLAPKLLGGRGSRGSVGGPDPLSLDEAFRLGRLECRRCGGDLVVAADVKAPDEA